MSMVILAQRFGRILVENGGLGLFLGGVGFHRILALRNGRSFSSSDTDKENKRTCDQGNPLPERIKSRVYTRTGDKGTSSLYNGERRSKTDRTFDVLGHQDELNAVIGIAREYCAMSDNGLADKLAEIESRLFDLGAAVATPVKSTPAHKTVYTEFPAANTATLEEWIDHMDAALPPLRHFIIPSGGLSSTHLNLARAVCRRAERAVYPLIMEEQVDAEVGRYLNRLSDFLFVAGRTAAMKEGKTETIWIHPADIKK